MSLECEASLINLKELTEKENGEVADEKINYEKSKVLLVGCVSIFYNDRGYIFIPHANRVLADYGKIQS